MATKPLQWLKSENAPFAMEMLAKSSRKPVIILTSSTNDTFQVMHERMAH